MFGLTPDQIDHYGVYIAFLAFVVAVGVAGALLAVIEYVHTRRNRG